jgi:hypothetical protein
LNEGDVPNRVPLFPMRFDDKHEDGTFGCGLRGELSRTLRRSVLSAPLW